MVIIAVEIAYEQTPILSSQFSPFVTFRSSLDSSYRMDLVMYALFRSGCNEFNFSQIINLNLELAHSEIVRD